MQGRVDKAKEYTGWVVGWGGGGELEACDPYKFRLCSNWCCVVWFSDISVQ